MEFPRKPDFTVKPLYKSFLGSIGAVASEIPGAVGLKRPDAAIYVGNRAGAGA